MDKVIIIDARLNKKSEDINLIENDQQIVDRDKRKDGVPFRDMDRKFRPSRLREDESDGRHHNDSEQYRGHNPMSEDSDSSYALHFPSDYTD